MKGRDYLWCLVHDLLDKEEELDRLCPACKVRAQEARCSACGQLRDSWDGAVNPAFDQARFERMRGGDGT